MFRREIDCPDCQYTGASKWTPLGILLWGLSIVLVVLSFIFWPLFLVWPILVVFLLFYPVGQTCPECDERKRGTA
jgi:hypothetical protein